MKHNGRIEEEWDWPPPRHRRASPQIDGRIERERVVLRRPRGTPGIGDGVADIFFRAIVGFYKIVFAVALTGVVIGSVWLIGMLLRSG